MPFSKFNALDSFDVLTDPIDPPRKKKRKKIKHDQINRKILKQKIIKRNPKQPTEAMQKRDGILDRRFGFNPRDIKKNIARIKRLPINVERFDLL